VRLRIRPYVTCAHVPAGVCVSAAQRSFFVQGSGVFPIVERLLSRLDGRRSREDILEGLPTQGRKLLDALLRQLEENDMLAPPEPIDLDLQTHRSSPSPTDAYFFDQGVPAAAFERMRSEPIWL